MNVKLPRWCCSPFALVLLLACNLEAADAPAAITFDAEVMIPMRDGTRLAANIFRPKGQGRFPAILMRTPYGKGDTNSAEGRHLATAGYVLVVQDCRGRGKSEGTWEPFRYDVEDGFDTQEWVGKQPWCNGDIGTSGGSYVGWTQWASAPRASSHLKALAAAVPFDNAYDLAYVGGAFQLALLMGWGTGVGGLSLNPVQLGRSFLHLPLNTFGDQFEKPVFFLNEWARHPQYDDYWKSRSIDFRYADVTAPILNVGGWYDIFAKTTIESIGKVRAGSHNRAMRRNLFVVMGPWTHGVGTRKAGELDFGPEAALNLGEMQMKWFEYWLRGRETGVQDWPALKLFVMGENRWRGESEWPLARTKFVPYYLRGTNAANSLQGGGHLDTTLPEDEPADHFTYDGNDPVPSLGGNNLVGASAGPCDQSKLEERQDILVYTSLPQEKPVEVTGPVKLILYAASSALDTDFTGKLVDVYPNGKAYNLCEGILRARYRQGRDKPVPLEPGKAERLELDLWVTSNVFLAGHRIRLEVSSSNFPRFDRNPNSGKPFGTDTKLLSAQQSIFHNRDHPSHLLLPLIPR